MHIKLTNLLQKRGIEDPTQLSAEEKATFDEWRKVLDKDEWTIEDVKSFCGSQVGLIENKWKDLDKGLSQKAELIPYHTIYKTILLAIESPKLAKHALEQQINQLLK